MQTSGLAEVGERMGCGSAWIDGGKGCCDSLCACEGTAPVLVLALGNPLMADDGAGQEVLARIQSDVAEWGTQVELVDGGTQGLALLGMFEHRKGVVFLDAVRLGHQAGAVHLLNGQQLLRMGGKATSAHEGSAPDILRALELLGDAPAEIALIGIEPERLQTGIGLSAAVTASIGRAADLAREAVRGLIEKRTA